jgi:hypothetical protein
MDILAYLELCFQHAESKYRLAICRYATKLKLLHGGVFWMNGDSHGL